MQTKFFVTTDNIFSIKRVAKKFHVVTTMTKKCRKKGAKLLWFFFFGLSPCRRHLALHVLPQAAQARCINYCEFRYFLHITNDLKALYEKFST